MTWMKAGRNDPCPCESGKKYKYCCMREDREIHLGEILADETTMAQLRSALLVIEERLAKEEEGQEEAVAASEEEIKRVTSARMGEEVKRDG